MLFKERFNSIVCIYKSPQFLFYSMLRNRFRLLDDLENTNDDAGDFGNALSDAIETDSNDMLNMSRIDDKLPHVDKLKPVELLQCRHEFSSAIDDVVESTTNSYVDQGLPMSLDLESASAGSMASLMLYVKVVIVC